MCMSGTWDLEIVWKNTETGATVKKQISQGHNSRVEAEDEFGNHFDIKSKGKIIPIGFLTSTFGVRETLDPFCYFLNKTQKAGFK